MGLNTLPLQNVLLATETLPFQKKKRSFLCLNEQQCIRKQKRIGPKISLISSKTVAVCMHYSTHNTIALLFIVITRKKKEKKNKYALVYRNIKKKYRFRGWSHLIDPMNKPSNFDRSLTIPYFNIIMVLLYAYCTELALKI